MVNVIIILLEIISLNAFLVLIFIFSILSTDSIIIILSLMLYLIILIPFLSFLNYFQTLMYVGVREGLDFFETLIFFSRLMTYIIGIILFIELIYSLLFN